MLVAKPASASSMSARQNWDKVAAVLEGGYNLEAAAPWRRRSTVLRLSKQNGRLSSAVL